MDMIEMLLISFLIAVIASQGGISGAFLILPIMVTFYGFTSPAASATNFIYNIVAIPGGVYRYWKEGRLLKPIFVLITLGSLPGMLVGAIIRTTFLLDPLPFKLFISAVLFYLAFQLIRSIKTKSTIDVKFEQHGRVNTTPRFEFGVYDTKIQFWDEEFRIGNFKLLLLSFLVGIVSGAYGVGGGAIIAPFLISHFGLPVYITAGATLTSTYIASIAGVAFYTSLSYPPDWGIGLMIGAGGFAGMYVGARLQKFMPQKTIKILVAILILALAFRNIISCIF
jgi:hypothetical protein